MDINLLEQQASVVRSLLDVICTSDEDRLSVLNSVAQEFLSGQEHKVELRMLRMGDTFTRGDGVVMMLQGLTLGTAGPKGWPCVVLHVPSDIGTIKRGSTLQINPNIAVIPIDPYSILRRQVEVLHKERDCKCCAQEDAEG
jgi:hypothetical protein